MRRPAATLAQSPPPEQDRAAPFGPDPFYFQGLLLIGAFAVTFIPAYALFALSPLRLITYAVPVFVLFSWVVLFAPKLHFDTRYVTALGLYAALLVFSAFGTIEQFDQITWVNALRPIFYLLMFVPLMVFDTRSVRLVIAMFALTMLLQSFSGNFKASTDFSFGESRGLLESGLAFPLGAVLLFCLRYGQRAAAILVALLFLIAFKRIAMAAVLAILAAMLLIRLISALSGVRESYLAFGLILLCAAGTVWLNLNYFAFFEAAASMLDINQTVYSLTMGRSDEFQILAMQSGNQSLEQVLFGNGPGWARRNLVEVTIDYPLQVHNAYLLHYYDFGVVGFGVFMLAFLIIYSRNVMGLYLYSYNLIVMITDSCYTFHYYQFTCFVLIGAAHYLDWRREQEQDAMGLPAPHPRNPPPDYSRKAAVRRGYPSAR